MGAGGGGKGRRSRSRNRADFRHNEDQRRGSYGGSHYNSQHRVSASQLLNQIQTMQQEQQAQAVLQSMVGTPHPQHLQAPGGAYHRQPLLPQLQPSLGAPAQALPHGVPVGAVDQQSQPPSWVNSLISTMADMSKAILGGSTSDTPRAMAADAHALMPPRATAVQQTPAAPPQHSPLQPELSVLQSRSNHIEKMRIEAQEVQRQLLKSEMADCERLQQQLAELRAEQQRRAAQKELDERSKVEDDLRQAAAAKAKLEQELEALKASLGGQASNGGDASAPKLPHEATPADWSSNNVSVDAESYKSWLSWFRPGSRSRLSSILPFSDWLTRESKKWELEEVKTAMDKHKLDSTAAVDVPTGLKLAFQHHFHGTIS